MDAPVSKGDGKIILSFKDNQCVVETEYEPAPPTPPPVQAVLSREPQLPFHQTILAGNPHSPSWLTGLIVFQGISMIIGVLIMIGIGVYLISRSQDSQVQTIKTQVQLQNQEKNIDSLKSEVEQLSTALKRVQALETKESSVKSDLEINPTIETNGNR